jgi:hypothetical protein
MADKAAQDMQAMKLRDRSEESAREEVRVLIRNPHLKIFFIHYPVSPKQFETSPSIHRRHFPSSSPGVRGYPHRR